MSGRTRGKRGAPTTRPAVQSGMAAAFSQFQDSDRDKRSRYHNEYLAAAAEADPDGALAQTTARDRGEGGDSGVSRRARYNPDRARAGRRIT